MALSGARSKRSDDPVDVAILQLSEEMDRKRLSGLEKEKLVPKLGFLFAPISNCKVKF
jgi:hypothetical protein